MVIKCRRSGVAVCRTVYVWSQTSSSSLSPLRIVHVAVWFCFSSCITHMYRLQMHSRYASPSLCINTITRLVHTSALAVSVLLSFLFYVSLLLLLLTSTLLCVVHRCAVVVAVVRAHAFNCISELMYMMMLIRLHQIVWCFTAHWIEQPIEQNKNNVHLVHEATTSVAAATTTEKNISEEDECLTRIWSFLQRLKNFRIKKLAAFLFMNMRKKRRTHIEAHVSDAIANAVVIFASLAGCCSSESIATVLLGCCKYSYLSTCV